MAKLKEEFFARKSREVAKELVGMSLVRALPQDEKIAGVIEETEAFYGEGKRTTAKDGLYYPPGKLYIMSFRGNHFLNIATQEEGEPSVVMVRGVYLPEENEHLGPGKLGKAFHIDKSMNHMSIFGQYLWIEDELADGSVIYVPSKGTFAPNSKGRYQLRLD